MRSTSSSGSPPGIDWGASLRDAEKMIGRVFGNLRDAKKMIGRVFGNLPDAEEGGWEAVWGQPSPQKEPVRIFVFLDLT